MNNQEFRFSKNSNICHVQIYYSGPKHVIFFSYIGTYISIHVTSGALFTGYKFAHYFTVLDKFGQISSTVENQ